MGCSQLPGYQFPDVGHSCGLHFAPFAVVIPLLLSNPQDPSLFAGDCGYEVEHNVLTVLSHTFDRFAPEEPEAFLSRHRQLRVISEVSLGVVTSSA